MPVGGLQSSELLRDRTGLTTGQVSKTTLIVGVGMRIVMKSLETILKTNLGVWMTQPLFYLTFLSELFFLFR